MNFRKFCFLLTILCLAFSFCSCALLGFTDMESTGGSTQTNVSKDTSTSTNVGEDLAWPKNNALAKLVPEFSAGRTTEIIENEFYVRFKITDVTKKDFTDYISKLVSAGYQETVYTADTLFSAIKDGNSELGVVIYLNGATITLEVAKEIPLQVSTESLPDDASIDESIADESNFEEISEDTSSVDEPSDESLDESVSEE